MARPLARAGAFISSTTASLRAIFTALAVTVACVFSVFLAGVTPPEAGAATPSEAAGIIAGCIGNPHSPVSVPLIDAYLYNLPGNASPTVTGTVSAGANSTAFGGMASKAGGVRQNAYYLSISIPSWAHAGQAVWVSMAWSDGVGGGGSTHGPQIVGIPPSTIGNGCPSPNARFPARISGMAAMQDGSGYWLVTSQGSVVNSQLGSTNNYGDLSYVPLNQPVVGMTSTPDGLGYWLVAADGGVFNFGSATYSGSAGGLPLNAPIVGIAATPDGGGYWLVASDGGVFAYGDAPFDGSMGGKPLNAPIVGMTADQATGGYWLVAADGGVFSFNAAFHGSTGSLVLNQPIMAIEAAPDGSGYRLGARDGGVFSFDLAFLGSRAGTGNPVPFVAITGVGSDGYFLADCVGGVYVFGTAQYNGGAGSLGAGGCL